MPANLLVLFIGIAFLFLPSVSTVCNEFVNQSCGGILPVLALLILPFFRLSKISVLVLSSVFLLYAQWGLVQFILQHDLGFYLLGESHLAPDITAVAKFSLGETKVIRAYGPYPHANTLGGILLGGLLLTAYLSPRKWYATTSFVFLIGILVTFSRSALIGALVLLVLRPIHDKQFRYVSLALCLLFLPLMLFRFSDPQDEAFSERFRGYQWAQQIIYKQAPISINSEAYTTRLRTYLDNHSIRYEPWEIAPVHSVPLLLAANYGLLSMFLIACFVFWRQVQLRSLALLPLIPPLLLDHYFITNVSAFALLVLIVTSIPQRR